MALTKAAGSVHRRRHLGLDAVNDIVTAAVHSEPGLFGWNGRPIDRCVLPASDLSATGSETVALRKENALNGI
jgi:hypothetical protein